MPPSQGRNTPRGGNAAHMQAKRAERAQGRARPSAPTQAERSDPQQGGANAEHTTLFRAVGGSAERGSRRRAAKTRGGGEGERRQGGGEASHAERSPPDKSRPLWQTGSGTKREVKTRPSAHGRARKRTPFHKVFIFSSHNISRYLSLFFTMHRYFVIIPHCDRVGWSLGGFVLHLVQLGKGAGLRHIRRKPCGVKQGGYFLR